MKTASLNEIRNELAHQDFRNLLNYNLRLARFKKENKELLSFLLFESNDIENYILKLKSEIEDEFLQMNKSNVYFIKKSVRKILRNLNKQIRITLSKQVEAELLIHFCNCWVATSIPVNKSKQLATLYEKQIKGIEKTLPYLHPDLQYDLKRKMAFSF